MNAKLHISIQNAKLHIPIRIPYRPPILPPTFGKDSTDVWQRQHRQKLPWGLSFIDYEL